MEVITGLFFVVILICIMLRKNQEWRNEDDIKLCEVLRKQGHSEDEIIKFMKELNAKYYPPEESFNDEQ